MIKIPKIFFPKYNCELIRLGNNSDGGYVVEKKSIENSEILISFGLSNDWSFEKEYSNFSKKKVFCYDLSVNIKFWIKDFIRSILNIFFLKEVKKNTKNLFTFFKYKKFFDGKNNFHIKKHIISKKNKKNIFYEYQLTDLNEILHRENKPCYLKIDIEGAEYRILNQIIFNQSKITGLSIEFHDFDINLGLIKDFINNLDLEIVHLHVNNFGLINENSIPSVVEISFTKKDFVEIDNLNNKNYPLDLDMPCNVKYLDEKINFY